MSNKKNKKKNSNYKKNIHDKKVLDGVDLNKNSSKNFDQLIKEIRNDEISIELQNGKSQKNNIDNKTIKNNLNINEKIQSFISILFTIIIFILLILIIFVIYNNYIKKENNIDKLEVCKDYIKKDYKIKEDDIKNYIKDNRYILYNVANFDNTNIKNDDLLAFSKYIIWNSDNEYLYCDELEINCLDTKKEMSYNDLLNSLTNYFELKNIKIEFPDSFDSLDDTRLYQEDDKVVLTFKEMKYTTLKHDIIDILIDEDNIEIIFALSKKNGNIYSYAGSKKIFLKFQDNNFNLNKIVTNINN